MSYYIRYDGTMSSIRRTSQNTDPEDVEQEYTTMAKAKAELVLYAETIRDDWIGLIRDVRRERAQDVETD